MNYDLMMAVLSMAAYLDDKPKIGLATRQTVAEPNGYLSSGFSAVAYSYNGQTIISYRGTDSFVDVLTGWTQGLGFASVQAGQAAEFYKSVVGPASFPYSTNVVFTGHSLGGGLAGLMASLYGKQAIVFDNEAYSDASHLIHDTATNPNFGSHQSALDTFYGNATPNARQSKLIALEFLISAHGLGTHALNCFTLGSSACDGWQAAADELHIIKNHFSHLPESDIQGARTVGG